MPVLDGSMTMPVLVGVKPMAITLPICGTSESLFWKRKKSIYCWTRSRPTWTFGESDDQVRDKSESKYQRVQDKSETIEKRLESGLESETGLEYYSPNKTIYNYYSDTIKSKCNTFTKLPNMCRSNHIQKHKFTLFQFIGTKHSHEMIIILYSFVFTFMYKWQFKLSVSMK